MFPEDILTLPSKVMGARTRAQTTHQRCLSLDKRIVLQGVQRSISCLLTRHNSSGHRVRTTILQAEKLARNPGFACITLLCHVSATKPASSFSIAVARSATLGSVTIKCRPTPNRRSCDRSMYRPNVPERDVAENMVKAHRIWNARRPTNVGATSMAA